MAYRVHKRRKVVEVNGSVDLATIWRKVEAAGGPDGWRLSTYITGEEFSAILERMGFGGGDEQEGDPEGPRPIGFRLPGGPYEPGIETGLPYHDLHEPDEE